MKYMFVQHYEGYYPHGLVVRIAGLYYYIHETSNHDGKRYFLRGVKKKKNGLVVHDNGWGCSWVKHEDITPVSELPAGFINNSQWLKCA